METYPHSNNLPLAPEKLEVFKYDKVKLKEAKDERYEGGNVGKIKECSNRPYPAAYVPHRDNEDQRRRSSTQRVLLVLLNC